MPTYEYRCDNCDRTFDVVQSFHDEPLAACPTCESPVRRVFGSVGIVFKGSGFYKTDSRTATGAGSKDAAGSKDGDSTSSAGTDRAGAERADSHAGTDSGTKAGSGDPSPTSTASGSDSATPASPKGNGKSSTGPKESAKT